MTIRLRPEGYRPTRLHPRPDAATWATYEAGNRKAAEDYRHNGLPICGCGRPVRHKSGMCWRCRYAALREETP